MPTPGGKPKVGEYLVWPDGTRRKVLRRSDGESWAVHVEGLRDGRDGWLTEAQWWIDYLGLKIEKGDDRAHR